MRCILFLTFIIYFPIIGNCQTTGIHVIDIGEGQAILLKRGKHGALIDTGHFGQGHHLLKTIESAGVSLLDRIYLTHLHPDHSTAIFTIMNTYKKAVIYESGIRYPFDPHGDTVRWVEEALDDKRWQVETVSQGDTHLWKDFKLQFLWPPKNWKSHRNDDSLVMQISFGDHVILVMGDATCKVEKNLLKHKLLPEEIDILVVGHHGAKDASCSSFIDHVNPSKAVISVNKNNLRGYPAEEVINRLKERGIKTHITSKDGTFSSTF